MMRPVIVAIAAVCVVCVTVVPATLAQDRADQVRELAEKLKQVARSYAAQRFSVVLVVSSELQDPATDDIPPPARKALEDMKGFLPFKKYRLFGSVNLTVPAPGRYTTARITGGDNQVFDVAVSWSTPSAVAMLNNKRAAPALLDLTFMLQRAVERPLGVNASTSESVVVMSTPVTMNVGETVVVGTSRADGTRALLALLTAQN